MAFSSTTTSQAVFGNKRVVIGEYAQGNGDTGGAIATGLGDISYFDATGATKITTSGGTATIVTADPTAAVTGFWMAIG
jgi:hypothetical protein